MTIKQTVDSAGATCDLVEGPSGGVKDTEGDGQFEKQVENEMRQLECSLEDQRRVFLFLPEGRSQ